MTTFTRNFRLTKPDFNSEGWDTQLNADLDVIDALIGQFNTGLSIQGIWLNATLYTAGQSVIDALTGHIWLTSTTHTSSASPTTFAQDRISFPAYWSDVTNPAASAAVSATAATASATASATSATTAAGSATAAAASATAAAGSATTSASNLALVTSAFRNYIAGLTLSNDSGTPNTILDVAAGVCNDSTNATIITLAAFTKTTAGVWVTGTGNAGMGTGLTIANSTWYHVFAIIVSGVADVYFDTSITAANKPASTTAFRRIGSFKTNGSAQILAFSQFGNRFDWGTPVVELTASVPGITTAITRTLLGVPLGVVVEGIFAGAVGDASNANSGVYYSSLATADVAANGGSAITTQIGVAGVTALGPFAGFRVVTNAAQQIRSRVNFATTSINLHTYGWIDLRGNV